MAWDTAQRWIAAMNAQAYLGQRDWRLPTLAPLGASFSYDCSNNGSTDHGYAETGTQSEMAYMYYVNLANLGVCVPNGGGSATSCYQQNGAGLRNTGPFRNLQSAVYWSGLEYAPDASYAWSFGMNDGGQSASEKVGVSTYAWAVLPGDVGASLSGNVPEPATLCLPGLGPGMPGLARRRG